MPISKEDLNQINSAVGRLLTEFMRTGKEVPRGFQGTLRDYARQCVMESSDFDISPLDHCSCDLRNEDCNTKESCSSSGHSVPREIRASYYWNHRAQRYCLIK